MMRVKELIFAYGPSEAMALVLVGYALFLIAATFVVKRNNRQAVRFSLWAWVAVVMAGGARAISAFLYHCCGPLWIEIIDMHRSICCSVLIAASWTTILLALAAIRASATKTRLQLLGAMAVSAVVAGTIMAIMALAMATEMMWNKTF